MGNQIEFGKVIWKETVSTLLEDLIEVRDTTSRDGESIPNVNVLVYDCDEGDKRMQYLRGAIISSAKLDVVEPKSETSKRYSVFSVTPEAIVGETLADFQLMPQELVSANPMLPLASPPSVESTLRVSLVDL